MGAVNSIHATNQHNNDSDEECPLQMAHVCLKKKIENK